MLELVGNYRRFQIRVHDEWAGAVTNCLRGAVCVICAEPADATYKSLLSVAKRCAGDRYNVFIDVGRCSEDGKTVVAADYSMRQGEEYFSKQRTAQIITWFKEAIDSLWLEADKEATEPQT